VSSAGQEAVELAASAGLILDPWQEWVLRHSLGELDTGLWAAFEVGLVVSRQNGKGSILEARELAGLFLLDEELIIHSAHEFKTAAEAFRRLEFLISNTPDLHRRVKKYDRAHGNEGIELKNGQRIKFATRTGGGGRGFTADLVIWDEAMILSEAMQGATLPTLSTVPNPQVWYTGSAVNQQVHQHGQVFAKVRDRAITGKGAGRLLFAEWSADTSLEALLDDPSLMDNQERWAEANPSLGIRISRTYIQTERDALTDLNFAVERLSIGDWPDPDGTSQRIISKEAWSACGSDDTGIVQSPTYAVDVQPGFKSAAIAAAGQNAADNTHVEIIEHRDGARWVTDRMKEIVARNGGKVIIDPKSPAGALIKDLKDTGVDVHEATTNEYTAACSLFLARVTDKTLRYPAPQPELTGALNGAGIRPVGDSWAWSRKASDVDISPLVAGTLAQWGATHLTVKPEVYSLREMVEQMKEERANGRQPQPV
jgi:hypothetical protein